MQIQSKRARFWVIIGLLGLIQIFIYPFISTLLNILIGPIGKAIGDSLSGFAVVALLVGLYVESVHKKTVLKNK